MYVCILVAHAALAWRNKTQRSQMGSVDGDQDLPDLPASDTPTPRTKKVGLKWEKDFRMID